MNIAFDATPLIGEKMTGIGWCEAGQTAALARLFPENEYTYTFFSRKNHETKLMQIEQFAKSGIGTHYANFSGFAYKALSSIIPLSYSSFFGKKYDITHFFNYIIPHGVHGRKVVTVHDMVYKAFPETVRFRTRQMLNTGLKKSMKRADVIVTDSEFSKSEISKYFPEYENKVRVVPCGVDLERFKPCEDMAAIANVKSKLGIDGDYFLYLGTIEPRKNLERLIIAYHALNSRHGYCPKLVLSGGRGWLYDAIFAKVTELKLTEKVVFTEYVPSEALTALICGAVAFVFPSIYEGFGMPPLEAMACGVPVLTSASASLPEVTGNCAVTVDAFSTESIADGLERLCDDSELRMKLGKLGHERAKSFTWERSAEMLNDIYENLRG